MRKNLLTKTVSIFLLIAVVASMAVLAGCGGPKQVTVPDVVGKAQADAEKELTDLGLTMTVQRERFSSRNAKGTVDKMTTEAGTTVPEGTEVKVIMSLGEGIPVPNIGILSLKEAESLLKAVDLNPVVVEEYSDEVEAGNIISYTDGGQTIAVGSDVTITVSKGPKP